MEVKPLNTVKILNGGVSIFEPMATWFKEAAKKHIAEHLLLLRERQGVLLKVNQKLLKVWVSGFPEELQTSYTCDLCSNYLNGVGSLVYVDGDDYTITPFGLPPIDDNTPEEWKSIYKDLHDHVATNKANLIIPTAESDMSNWFGKPFNTSEKGYFTHFNSGYEDDVLRKELKEVLISPVGTGLGLAEITILSNWLNVVKDTDFEGFRKSDIKHKDFDMLATFELIKSDLNSRKYDMTIYTRYWLAYNGLHLIHMKNSSVGQIIENINRGDTHEVALGKYLSMIDSRYYKRPVKMPSEAQFEKSVAFLESKGYDKYLALRPGTFEDIQDQLTWVKPEIAVAEVTGSKSVFAALRKKVATVETQVTKKPTFDKPTSISAESFINTVLKGEEKVLDVKLISTQSGTSGWSSSYERATIGGVAVSVEEGVNPIFKEGKMPVKFVFSDPIQYKTQDYFTEVNLNGSVDGVIGEKRDDRDGFAITLIFKNAVWKTRTPTPIFPDSLISELYDHRRVIEHYGRNTFMNVDETGKVIPFENGVATIVVSEGTVLNVEFEKSVRRYTITS